VFLSTNNPAECGSLETKNRDKQPNENENSIIKQSYPSIASMRPYTTAIRPLVRQSAGRRFASSSSTGTEAAQKRAQDALGSMQKNAEKVWESARKFMGPVGETMGNLLGCEWPFSVLSPYFYIIFANPIDC
jgi:hypothetical protein